jgi:hypothetical protein
VAVVAAQGNQPDPNKSTQFSLPVSLTAGVALLVSVLAAVGVAGDTLTRAVRNAPPYVVVGVIVGVLIAMAVPLFASNVPTIWKIAVGALIAVLAGGLFWVTGSIAEREQPLVTLVPSHP